ncbi:DUF3151 domain-containing protein [Kineosporia succinea]|uniref:DUF3151 domain-containing protein n=1 Tax=Kineosporia succinea TaxID=84632 RepID=UPI0035222CF0
MTSVTHPNLLNSPPPTLLPDDAVSRDAIAAGAPLENVAATTPSHCLPWAALAERAHEGGRDIEAYAYARTGYHRGLDALRRNGWKGHGPVPWSHVPNQGFLRALAALGQAAAAIGEDEERDRIAQFVADCDPEAAHALNVLSWAVQR